MSEPRAANGRFLPGNSRRFRRDGEPPPPDLDPSRAKLRQALARSREEAERLDGLSQALERCHGELLTAQSALQVSIEELAKARHVDKRDLAYRYAEGAILEMSHSIEAAEALVARNRAEVERLSEVEEALDGEVKASRARAVARQMSLREALSELVCSSEQFNGLLEQLDQLWGRMRGLHKCFRTLSAALGGLPDQHFRRIHRVVSMDPDVIVGEPQLDERPAAAWASALAALAQDPDHPLPETGGIE
jgi:hypothetical protein